MHALMPERVQQIIYHLWLYYMYNVVHADIYATLVRCTLTNMFAYLYLMYALTLN